LKLPSPSNLVLFTFIGAFMFSNYIGQDLYRVTVAVLIIYMGYKMLIKGSIRVNYAIIWYFGFITISLFSLLYAPDINYDQFETVVNTGILILVISQHFDGDKEKKIKEIMAFMVFWGSLFTCYTLYKIIPYGNLMFEGRLGSELLSEYFSNAIALSYYTITITIVLIWYAIYEKKYKIVVIPLLISTYFLCILTGGRQAFLIPLLLFAILLILKNRFNINRSMVTILLIPIVFYIVYQIVITIPSLYNILGVRIEELISAVGGEDSQESIVGRSLRMEHGWAWFGESPLIGHGLGSSRFLLEQSLGVHTHTHNNFLEILVSGGILLFTVYYWIYGYIIVKLWRLQKVDNHGLPQFFLAFNIIILLVSFGTTTYNLFIFHIFSLLSVLFISKYNKKI
jgi:O-antigen ligase